MTESAPPLDLKQAEDRTAAALQRLRNPQRLRESHHQGANAAFVAVIAEDLRLVLTLLAAKEAAESGAGNALTLESDGWGEHWIARGGKRVCDYNPSKLDPDYLTEVLSALSSGGAG